MTDQLSPVQIINKASECYGNLQTYQDFGFVQRFDDRGPDVPPRKYFTTKFKRPNLFQFQFNDQLLNDSEIFVSNVWSKGKSTFRKMSDEPAEQILEFIPAPNGSFGVHSEFMPPILALLMPSVQCQKLANSLGMELINEEFVVNDMCFCLQQMSIGAVSPRESLLWISKERQLLVATEETMVIDPARMSALFGNLYSDHEHLDFELKVELVRKALREMVSKMTNMPMSEKRLGTILQSIKARKVVEKTVYERIVLDAHIDDDVFNEPLSL